MVSMLHVDRAAKHTANPAPLGIAHWSRSVSSPRRHSGEVLHWSKVPGPGVPTALTCLDNSSRTDITIAATFALAASGPKFMTSTSLCC